MKDRFSKMSDNLYYADEIGTIAEQIKFLDSLNFTEPQISFDYHRNHEIFMCLAHTFVDNIISTYCVCLFPSRPLFRFEDSEYVCEFWPRKFGATNVLDIKSYLMDRGFEFNYSLISFSKKLCLEEENMAEDTTVGVEEEDQSHSED